MKIKGINDLFCSSPASTAICLTTTTDQRCLLPPPQHQHQHQHEHGGVGGRAIDRHNPHLRDRRRTGSGTTPPAALVSSSSSSSRPQSSSHPPKDSSKKKQHPSKKKKKSRPTSDLINNNNNNKTPPTSSSSSSRYLLAPDHSDNFFDILTEFQPLPTSLPPPTISTSSSSNPDPQLTSSKSPSSTDDHQVVVLKVSLHCKGCERKVRKHISQVKGVTSFDIDFFKKKVTVVGDVTPLGVLASISRVKNAQFWPSMSSSSPVKSK